MLSLVLLKSDLHRVRTNWLDRQAKVLSESIKLYWTRDVPVPTQKVCSLFLLVFITQPGRLRSSQSYWTRAGTQWTWQNKSSDDSAWTRDCRVGIQEVNLSVLTLFLSLGLKDKYGRLPEHDDSYMDKVLSNHIHLLHDYNQVKDLGQMLMGKYAEIKGTTTSQMYEEFGLDLQD